MEEIGNFKVVEMQETEISSKLKKLPKPIGYERGLLLAQRNHKDSPGYSKEDTEQNAEVPLADSESWIPWLDDRLERAVAEVFNFKPLEDFWMSLRNIEVENEMTIILSNTQTAEEVSRESADSTSPDRSENDNDDDTLTTSTPAESNTILSETEAATAVVLSQSGITQTTTTASVAFESEQTEQSSAPDQIVASVAANNALNREEFIWNLDTPPLVPHNLINNLSCPILNGIRTNDAPLPILSAPIVNSSHRQSFTSIDQITLAIQSRPSIVHAKPSQSRNFPFVQRSGDGIVMPACYSGQFQQSRPSIVHAKPSQSRNFPFVQRSGDGIVMPACYSGQFQQTTPAATTSGSIGGNAAMSGYNYYSMTAYYTTSVTQTTPAATASDSIGGNAAMSGYNYYSMPAYYTTSVTQTTPAATTSGSIGGNAAMSGYNYYSMPIYYVASVAQTTLYNQAGTIYGASGIIGQPSGYGIPMSGYYQMPQNPSTVNRQYGSGMFYGQQPVVYPSVAQATAYSSFPRTHEQMSIWSVWNEWYSQSRSYVLHNNDEYPSHQT
ncbi:Uncharacterized protein BM_BM13002 [Brugia malayi]|uniref:Uncharacterized protein n=1 Tax=Brugia malayi TaxID=6279 RepID=A0A4E9F6M3_BRUMA|nr:Uncharacterized protein BM_BM13002 [Brugia malayi]VIO92473.1 Uncharacterized protein BM_BM13002 [Brugia malayi]